MKVKNVILIFLLFNLYMLVGCNRFSEQLIANRYAEAVLTKNNELVFRFKINQTMLESREPYKVKVTINNQKLAAALGTEEIIYGEEIVHSGEFLEAKKQGLEMIDMSPVSLKKDLHPFELKKMIEKGKAVTVEVYNKNHIIGKAILTNFATQL